MCCRSTSSRDRRRTEPCSGPQRVTFQIKSDDPISLAHVEIATQPTLGQDGTLAQEFTVPAAGYLLMTRGDAFPDTYTAVFTGYAGGYGVPGSWSTQPGTYYWQASYTSVDIGPPPAYTVQTNTHTTPVYRLVIQAPPAPTPTPAPSGGGYGPSPSPPPFMTLARANGYVRPVIRRAMHHNAYHLKRKCKRLKSASFACSISWGTTLRLHRNTMIYAGTLTLSDPGGQYINYTFSGVRARESCLQHHSVKKCAGHVAW